MSEGALSVHDASEQMRVRSVCLTERYLWVCVDQCVFSLYIELYSACTAINQYHDTRDASLNTDNALKRTAQGHARSQESQHGKSSQCRVCT